MINYFNRLLIINIFISIYYQQYNFEYKISTILKNIFFINILLKLYSYVINIKIKVIGVVICHSLIILTNE